MFLLNYIPSFKAIALFFAANLYNIEIFKSFKFQISVAIKPQLTVLYFNFQYKHKSTLYSLH